MHFGIHKSNIRHTHPDWLLTWVWSGITGNLFKQHSHNKYTEHWCVSTDIVSLAFASICCVCPCLVMSFVICIIWSHSSPYHIVPQYQLIPSFKLRILLPSTVLWDYDSNENGMGCIFVDFINNLSALVLIMAISHYHNQCWQRPRHHIVSLGQNMLMHQ